MAEATTQSLSGKSRHATVSGDQSNGHVAATGSATSASAAASASARPEAESKRSERGVPGRAPAASSMFQDRTTALVFAAATIIRIALVAFSEVHDAAAPVGMKYTGA